MAVNVQELLLGAVTLLGGLVWNAQEKRISALEKKNEERAASDQTLREAVIKLTVTVEHLMESLGRGHGHEGE